MSERPEERRTYEELVKDAGAALREAEDLSPTQWAQIRGGVDEAGATRSWLVLRWGGAVGAVAILGLVVALGPWQDHTASTNVTESSGLSELKLPTTPVPPEEPVVGDAISVAELPVKGTRLQASRGVQSWSAFQRHELVVSHHGELEVNRWETQGMDLLLVSGAITAEVDKLKPDESFQIRTRDVVVRVVGTRFTVKLMPSGGTEVSVEEGVVEVTDRVGAVARLTGGERRKFGDSVEVETADDAEPPSTPVSRPRRAVPQDTRDSGSLKVIEIDVPPQSAPVPEQMRGGVDYP